MISINFVGVTGVTSEGLKTIVFPAANAGAIFQTLIGALIIGTLNNGLNLLGVSSFFQMVVKGIVIVIAVLIDRKKAA